MKIPKFQATLIFILVFLFVFMAVKDSLKTPEISEKENTVVVFTQPGCRSCAEEKRYINEVLRNKYPDIEFEYHDITLPKEMELLKAYFQKYGLKPEQLMTPITFTRENYLIK